MAKIGMIVGAIGAALISFGYFVVEQCLDAYAFWGIVFMLGGFVIVITNTIMRPRNKGGLFPPEPTFREVFHDQFDNEFGASFSQSMSNLDIDYAIEHPDNHLDIIFLKLWERLESDGTFIRAFEKAEASTNMHPDKKNFAIEAKAHYYGLALETHAFMHPLLGEMIAHDLEDDEKC